jgi:prepilin-type processing-associated H-X9-DG protein
MRCPSCNSQLPETGCECPTCGADTGWYIRKSGGQTYGPMDLATVNRCLAEARLLPGDMVRIGAEGLFRPAHEVLGDRFAVPPPPTTVSYRPAATDVSRETRQWLVKGCAIAGGVVAVIFVLGVVVSHITLRRVQPQATAVSCQSNLRQVNTALLMYCADWDDRYPLKAVPGGWDPPLQPYTRNSQLWVCPACPGELGYRHNDKLAGVKTSDVRRRNQTLTFWDAGANVQDFTPPAGTTSPRHSGSDNFAFADGHVIAAQPGQLQAHTDP